MASAPFQALRLILHGSGQPLHPGVVPLDYRDEAVFRDLWLVGLESARPVIGGRTLDWADGTQQVLIVGNEPPDGIFSSPLPELRNVNAETHFSACAWLAAWKVKFSPNEEEKKAGAIKGEAKIAVIDPREAGQAKGAAAALQALFRAKDSDGEQSLVPGTACFNAKAKADGVLDHILRWLEPEKKAEVTMPAPLRDLLRATIWNELTAGREKHHALSNVLGALLLGAQVGRAGRPPGEPGVQDYLLALVRACGSDANLEQIELRKQKGTKGFQRCVSSPLKRSIDGVVLIDDMAGIWEHFVRGATGFAWNGDAWFGNTGRSYRESLECFGTHGFHEEILKLPGRLVEFMESGRRRLRAGDLLNRGTKLGEYFVLLLDLRLFAEPEGEVAKTFNEGLRGLGRRILADSGRWRPWLDDAMVRGSLEKALAGTGHESPETLLPRLISLLDPTLPIVIFSSTHHSDLIDPFRNYGNIILDFRKPVLKEMSDWEKTAREAYLAFEAAMKAAAGIFEVRGLLAKLEPAKSLDK